MEVVTVMMKLIKSVIDQTSVDCSPFLLLSADQKEELYNISKSHSIDHLIGEALGKNCNTPIVEHFVQSSFQAVFQYELIENDLNTIYSVLQTNKIPFIPLKGSRLCKYYPEPWMRTRGDIDILIHKSDIFVAVEKLKEKGFKFINDNYHDVHLESSSGVMFELHFMILENNKNLDVVLSKVWEYSHQISGYEFEQTNEYFVFHQIAHMAYHFLAGGCGIRPFIDLYILKNKLDYDESVVVSLCKEAHIDTFYKYVQTLIEVWFFDKPYTTISQKMEEYIITGGVYGNIENRMLVKRYSNKRSFSFILSRMFLPYNQLIIPCPELKGHKYLLPYYEIKRWFKLLDKNKRNKLKKELEVSKSLETSSITSTKELLDQLELK